MNILTKPTLKEIARLTLAKYGIPNEDESLALQASIDAFELYGYDPLSYGEIAELEGHCEDLAESYDVIMADYEISGIESVIDSFAITEAFYENQIKVLEAEILILKGKLL